MIEQAEDGTSTYTGHLYLDLPLETRDPLDFAALAGETNPWNRRGLPTLSLAGDIGVVLAELGHHVDETNATSIARRFFRLEVELDALEDLRTSDPARRADPAGLHEEADSRRAAGCKGVIVPSVACADRPDSFNLVVFLENAGDWQGWVRSFVEMGGVVVGPMSPTGSDEDVAL